MAQNSKIEWCDHTANLWWGCTKVHAGCDHCYAETASHHWGFDVWGNDKPRRVIEGVWKDLSKFQKLAAASGEMHRVFVGSMMDIFEKPMPLIDKTGNALGGNTHSKRVMLFDAITLGKYPNLMFLFLTKRPSNINKYIPESWKTTPPSNVMFGTSPCDQETANTVIPQLLKVKGKKFLSVEPMLGPIIMAQSWIDRARYWELEGGTIDWVICGGESGPEKRPMNLDWARALRDECLQAGVPFFMKQIDKVQKIPDDLMIRQFP
jgi:protein gp37